jgi:type I restriction enzyme M protein
MVSYGLYHDLRSFSQKEKFELSVLYEAKIKRMGNAGRNGGVYYTPRPLIRAIIDVVKPRIGETVYDGAAGSAGFLCEAYNWMCNKVGIIEMMCDNWPSPEGTMNINEG